MIELVMYVCGRNSIRVPECGGLPSPLTANEMQNSLKKLHATDSLIVLRDKALKKIKSKSCHAEHICPYCRKIYTSHESLRLHYLRYQNTTDCDGSRRRLTGRELLRITNYTCYNRRQLKPTFSQSVMIIIHKCHLCLKVYTQERKIRYHLRPTGEYTGDECEVKVAQVDEEVRMCEELAKTLTLSAWDAVVAYYYEHTSDVEPDLSAYIRFSYRSNLTKDDITGSFNHWSI